jgi:hypothetical protein
VNHQLRQLGMVTKAGQPSEKKTAQHNILGIIFFFETGQKVYPDLLIKKKIFA